MGSVYLPAGRRRWVIKYMRDGIPITEATGTTDEKRATKILRDRETDIDRGVPLAPAVGKIRFEKAAAALISDYRLNGRKNLNGVQGIIDNHLAPVFGGRRMATITAGDAREYADGQLANGLKPATINTHLAALIRMFTICRREGTLLYQPKIAKLNVAGNVRQGFFERAEFDKVLAALPAWLRDPVEFAYLTGWRVQSEVLPLEWRQVAGGAVRLWPGTTKSGRGRVFPYDALPALATMLDRLARAAKVRQRKTGTIVPWVFHRDGASLLVGGGWAHKDVRAAWTAATIAAGCPGRLLHDLRRTAVRNLVRAGVPEKTAMQLTGHKTRSVFDRYDIVNEADLRAGVGRLAGAATTGAALGGRRRR